MNKKKKAQVSIYISFMFVAILIVIISAVLAPMAIDFNSRLYLAGENILNNSQSSIDKIQDPEVKVAIQADINAAKSATVQNIEVNASIFQYGWVFVLVLTALIFFLYTRQVVEFGGGGLV